MLRIFAQQSRKDPKDTSAHDKFVGLLKDDILKLDLAELDFGIYRILNYRRREIETFLDRELPLNIDAALAKLPGAATEDERRIFHHLYTFFSRYYDDGDFVTRPRRGRHAAYSVPYNGQDVHFWWATKGSHYTAAKASDRRRACPSRHRATKAPTAAGGRRSQGRHRCG
ncbi:MAG: hypothetical protein E6H48_04690 [Betaproteobacteria bacterium]|nr:MAG: hypothetical protein E6H48_04690 [Betaproteobacteria bacterium]